ncbi:MAG: pirin family protein [Nanoarchaeota archaeon]
MKKTIQKNSERGKFKNEWLDTHYSFSFSNYYNPKRLGFGKLLVLNDDIIKPLQGFPMHSHNNMEIITIILEGTLEHKDNMNNIGRIEENEIQMMSAGTGIMHSEYNPSKTKETKLLQIWIKPSEEDIDPRYEQKKIKLKENELNLIVTSKDIKQDTKLYLGEFKEEKEFSYKTEKDKGIFIFVIEGKIEVESCILNERDSIEITETDEINIKTQKNSKILIIETDLI